MHGSEIIHLRYKNNTPENTKNPINKMASEMASSKHRVSMTFTSKIQANNSNNKKIIPHRPVPFQTILAKNMISKNMKR